MHRVLIVLAMAALAYGQGKPAKAVKPAKGKPAAAKPAAAAPAGKSALDKATLEAYLRYQFQLPANLKVTVEDAKPSEVAGMQTVNVGVGDGNGAPQMVEFLVSADGSKIVQGKVFDVKKSPFAADIKGLKSEGAPALGPADAPVTLYVFSDFQCQYCKQAAQTLRAHLEKEYPTQVRMIFKDLPIEQIHPWAKQASMIGRCFQRLNPAAFWQYHNWVFEQQGTLNVENVVAKSLDFGLNRVDSIQLNQCVTGKLTAKDVEASVVEARALQVGSTPTLFVNGRRLVGSVPWEQLKAAIDFELNFAKTNPGAFEKEEPCCEVKLTLPGAK